MKIDWNKVVVQHHNGSICVLLDSYNQVEINKLQKLWPKIQGWNSAERFDHTGKHIHYKSEWNIKFVYEANAHVIIEE